MQDIKQQISELIRSARKRKELSQLEVAQRMNVTKATYNGYETGQQNLTIVTLQKIATALETPLKIDIK